MLQTNLLRLHPLLLVAALGIAPSFVYGQGEVLVEVDLSVANQITVTATAGSSAATVEGSDTTGFYFENFFNEVGGVVETLVSGDLTTTLNITDDSPNLFRLGDEDPGFNIWSLSVDAVLNFETGVQAFTGAGTWTVDAATFAIFESANAEGDIYFPADSEDDLADASFIGTYRILGKGGPCAFEVGDVNQDGAIDLLDVAPFVDSIGMTAYVCEADVNQDGSNDLLDVAPFVDLLAGG